MADSAWKSKADTSARTRIPYRSGDAVGVNRPSCSILSASFKNLSRCPKALRKFVPLVAAFGRCEVKSRRDASVYIL